MRWDGPRLLSRPLGVHWAGWETTTLRLQKCGWDLAVQYEIHRDGYTLLMRHEALKLYAVTDQITIERVAHDPGFHWDRVPVFNVVQIAQTLHSMRPLSIDFASFQQIDARPHFTQERIQRVEDFNIFALARGKSEEILVNRADMTVIEHLEAIKRLQEPQQHEIRQRILRSQETTAPACNAPRLHLVAQLVHLEEAA